jgi:hypothetical protein
MRKIVQLLVIAAMSVALVPLSPAEGNPNFPERIDLRNGWFPEGIDAGRGSSYFVGSLADGAVWKGNLRSGTGDVLAPGAPGLVSVGVAYERRRDRLWVAGGGPALFGIGDVRVYDASSGELLESFLPSSPGFLNDLTVTRHAVYVTDSIAQHLVVIPLGRWGALPAADATETLPLTGDFVLTEGFNLNGIVSMSGWLIVGQSSTGTLFRVDPATGITQAVDLGSGSLLPGTADGLELHGHTLYVVQNNDNLVRVLRLGPHLLLGRVMGDITDPGLDVPTTATVAAGRLWAVNARFSTTPGPDTEYWITSLPKRP